MIGILPGTAVRGAFLDGAPFGSVSYRGLNALRVVVRDALADQASQVVLTWNDHVIEEFPSNAAHEALSGPVLPRALERRPSGMESESPDGASNFGREDRIVVEDQKSMKSIWKGVA